MTSRASVLTAVNSCVVALIATIVATCCYLGGQNDAFKQTAQRAQVVDEGAATKEGDESVLVAESRNDAEETTADVEPILADSEKAIADFVDVSVDASVDDFEESATGATFVDLAELSLESADFSNADFVFVSQNTSEAELPVVDPAAAEPAFSVFKQAAGEPKNPAVDPVAAEPEVPAVDPVVVESEVPAVESAVAESEVPAVDPVAAEPGVPAVDFAVVESEVPAVDPVAAESEVPAVDPVVVESEAPAVDPVVAEPGVPAVDPVAAESEVPAVDPAVAEPENPAVDPVVVESEVPAVESVAAESEISDGVPSVAPLQNEVWIAGASGSNFYFYFFDGDNWTKKSSDEFFATDDPARATIVWAHGYQTDMSAASSDVFALRAVLDRAQRQTANDRAYRLVVWKWRSERAPQRLRKDAKEKAAFAEYDGRNLARLVDRLNPETDVALVGFSFGARVVGSALQTLATNGFASRGANRRVSLILVSAACDWGAFSRGGAYGEGALLATDVLNAYNPRDFALKFYPQASAARASAQGVVPLSAKTFPNAVAPPTNVNLSGAIGKKHSFVDAVRALPTERLSQIAF